MVSKETAFDREGALDRVDGDTDLYCELFEMFFDDLPSSFAKLQMAISERNGEALERAAHSIKGALGNLGATQAQEISYKLEICGREGEVDGAASELLTKLEDAIDAYKVEASKLC